MTDAAPVISVIVPAYNEEAYVGELIGRLGRVLAGPGIAGYEVIVVDDGSSDGTAGAVAGLRAPHVRLLRQARNGGKGAAVQAGIAVARGRFVLVQDADLEYFPEDIPALLAAAGGGGKVAVYGARLRDADGRPLRGAVPRHPGQSWGPAVANRVLSAWLALLFGRWIDDLLTGYKLYPREMFSRFAARTSGFETDHEMTAWLIRHGYRIVEVPVRYRPRSRAEGKKIRARDGVTAVRTIWAGRWRKDVGGPAAGGGR